jgi:DnaK suppressor protein
VAERATLLEQVADLDAEADVNNWREGGFDDDPADAGSASFERETAQSLSNHARNLLSQIDDAMRRMDAGTYGTCERCGETDRDRAARGAPVRHALHGLQASRRDRSLTSVAPRAAGPRCSRTPRRRRCSSGCCSPPP